MPAPNEFVWYKWFPVKAMTSLRFQSLTLVERGFYHKFYDLAAIAQPSSRRGWVYEHDLPAGLKDIARMLGVHTRAARRLLASLSRVGLVAQDERGAWGIPDFAKHQRKGPLRQRPDGLGSAESRAKSAQNRGKTGATDADADADADAEKRKRTLGDTNGVSPRSRCPFTKLTEIWNKYAQEAGFETVRNLSKSRKKKLTDRWKEWEATGSGLAILERICKLFASDPFYCGAGERGWKANLNYVIKNDTKWIELIEKAEAETQTRQRGERHAI